DAGREPDLGVRLGQGAGASRGVEVGADRDDPLHPGLPRPLQDGGEVRGEELVVEVGVGIHQHGTLSYHGSRGGRYLLRPGIGSVLTLQFTEFSQARTTKASHLTNFSTSSFCPLACWSR